jgi:hypothetical protein
MTGKRLIKALEPVTLPDESAHLEEFLSRGVPNDLEKVRTMDIRIGLTYLLLSGVSIAAVAAIALKIQPPNSKS